MRLVVSMRAAAFVAYLDGFDGLLFQLFAGSETLRSSCGVVSLRRCGVDAAMLLGGFPQLVDRFNLLRAHRRMLTQSPADFCAVPL